MIHFTEHAKERMAQRNIREEIITENLEVFYRYGFWNDRGDRLTWFFRNFVESTEKNITIFISAFQFKQKPACL